LTSVLAVPAARRIGVGAAATALALALAGTLGLLLIAAVVTSRGVGSTENDQGLRPDAVPADLAALFVSAAATCGLSPPLLAAQARQESGFRSDATSPAGADGIMQFMPGTWAMVGYDASGDGVADPRNAKDAIYSGARYDCQLRGQLASSGVTPGDLDRLMLAAYNAGPAPVEQCRCVPAYAETQNYVTSILNLAVLMATTASAPAPAVPGAPGALVYPLSAKAVLTSPFGWRTSPTTGASELHAGQDMAAPAGTPVLAATAGTVSVAGWTGGYGNYVCVDRDAHFTTCYGHLAQIGVSVGEVAVAGQQIGLEGSTGDATGPHLHFEVRLDGVPTDPLPYLPPGT
jgi:hypothetical protein